GVTHHLYPFELVDCSACGDGWFELHSIIGGPDEDLSFGILYLFLEDRHSIPLEYHVLFNPVRNGANPTFVATWDLPVDALRTQEPRMSPGGRGERTQWVGVLPAQGLPGKR